MRSLAASLALVACSGSVDTAAPTPTDATVEASYAGCAAGSTRGCACPTGAQGAQTCDATGRWRACACDPPRACVEGASVACACVDGREGAQVCDGHDRYSPCVCDPPARDASVLDVLDLTDVTDVVDVPDVPDVLDAADIADVPDVTDAADVVDVTDVLDASGTVDVVLCAFGERRCGGVCTDVSTAAAHCGECGHACLAGTACAAGVCGVGHGAWRTLGGDNQHTGVAAEERGVPPLARAWSVAVAFGALRAVAVESGRVFVTSLPSSVGESGVEALRVEDGARLWSRWITPRRVLGHPAVADGAVYFAHSRGSGEGNGAAVWSLDAATGEARWRAPIDASLNTDFYPPIVEGGAVFTHGGPSGGGIYALSTGDGALRFFQPLAASESWSPSTWAGSLYALVRGSLHRFDPITGALRSTTSVPWGVAPRTDAAPVFTEGRAVFTAMASIYAVDLDAEAVAWSASGGYSGTPAARDGVVYAIRGQTLVALSLASGEPLWTFAASESLRGAPVIAAGRAYVSGSAHVFAVNLTTHALEWTGDSAGWLSVAEGRLFVARVDGVLDAYGFTR